MDLPSSILGTPAARVLQLRASGAVLTIGRDHFSRADLAGVECFCFAAAARVAAAVAKLDVRDTRALFDNVPPEALAVPGIGVFSLAVLGAAFEAKGIGGDHPLIAWIRKHDTARKGEGFCTFETLKQRIDREQRDPGARRKRAKKGKA